MYPGSKNGRAVFRQYSKEQKTTNDCPFCVEYFQLGESQYYIEAGKKIGHSSRILLETDNWYVVPTMGSLTVGYVLLVAKEHYLSLANISAELLLEMLELKQKVEDIISRYLGKRCIAFEHGVTNVYSSGANSVDHIHLHIVPVEKSMWDTVLQTMPKADYVVTDSFEILHTQWQEQMPDSYLLFQDIDQKIRYFPDASNMPSQLFRKCLAAHLGADCWDWRKEVYLDNMCKTLELFSNVENM